MFRMRTRVSLALVALALILIPTLAFAQIEARLDALDEVLPQLYDGTPVTLSECLEVGEVASLSLAGYEEDLGVAERNKTAAWMQWLPTLRATAYWQRQERTDYDVPTLVPGEFQDITNRYKSKGGNLTANWTVFNGFDRLYEGKEAGANLLATEATYEYQRRLMRERISDAYYDLQRAYARVDVALEAKDLAAQELERTETYFELGISTKSDVLQAKVRHQQTELEVMRENTAEIRAFIVLAYAMNIPGADPFQVLKELPVVDPVEVRTLEELIAEADSTRLDLTAAEFSLEASNAGLNRARSSFYPQVQIFGRADIASNESPQALRFGAQENSTVAWGIQGSWDIFNGWRRMQQERQAVAAQRKAEYALRQTRLELELQIVDIYSNLIGSVNEHATLSTSVEASQEDLRLAEERFRVGAGTQLDVITAQVNLATARRDLVDAQVNYAKFLNQMRRAVGRDVVALH